jgi:dihydrolipoamide dehydrogenase
MGTSKEKTQVAVIGAGPGGYAAAFHAADLGMQVALIDPEENPGGVCLHVGCIPSKALLHVAKVIAEAGEAKAWGVTFSSPEIDLERMRQWKSGVVEKLTAGLGGLGTQRKIRYIRGKAIFRDPGTLDISLNKGGGETLAFDHAILATGSRPATVPGLAADPDRVMDSTGGLELRDIPKHLLVVGGGYIGLELGTVYAALGSKVTVVEMTSGLLPGVDRDLVSPLSKRLEGLFEAVLLDTMVKEMAAQKKVVKVKLEGKGLGKTEQRFDRVLMAVGRKPNSESLGLEHTRIDVDRQGFVQVDAQRRTREPTIYAIGDVAGEPMLAHKASHEGRVAAEAIAGRPAAFDPRAIPAVVFTDPEIAWCGLTEAGARQQGRKVKAVRFPWGASGRAATLGRADGVTKLVVDPETERILGVGIVGPGAGEMIAEGVLAIEMAAVAADLKLAIHPHPTLSETIMEAAELFFGGSTHYFRPKRK